MAHLFISLAVSLLQQKFFILRQFVGSIFSLPKSHIPSHVNLTLSYTLEILWFDVSCWVCMPLDGDAREQCSICVQTPLFSVSTVLLLLLFLGGQRWAYCTVIQDPALTHRCLRLWYKGPGVCVQPYKPVVFRSPPGDWNSCPARTVALLFRE